MVDNDAHMRTIIWDAPQLSQEKLCGARVTRASSVMRSQRWQ